MLIGSADEALQPAHLDERAGAVWRLRTHEAARRDDRGFLEQGRRAGEAAANTARHRPRRAEQAADAIERAPGVRAPEEGDDLERGFLGPVTPPARPRVRLTWEFGRPQRG